MSRLPTIPPRVVVFSGNTHRPSKSRSLAESLIQSISVRVPLDVRVFDLVDAGPGVGAFSRAGLPPEALNIVEAIENADALVISVPVYKGSYPGLFKHLFDFVDPTALVGKPVLITATGGGQRHALVVEHQLRPLFGFFSASTIPTAIYATDSEFLDGVVVDPILKERIQLAASQFVTVLGAGSRQYVGELV